MKVDIEKESNNIVKVNIEIPAKDAVDGYNKTVKKLSEHVNVPGFRKGKAPRNMVEQHIGVDRIKHEALEDMLPEIFKKAIDENNLDVIAQPYVDSYDFEIGKDVKLTATVELRPEVKLGQYKGLTVEVEEYQTPADAFDNSLKSFLERNATFSLVVDRAVKETDVVSIDFDGTSNGEKIKGGAAENYPLDIANSNFIPGFAEQLAGHKLNEEFDINVSFPENYHDAKLAGQPAIFKIKIKEIKEKVLPELTDEFAKKVGNFDSVDALKADIQNFLDSNKTNEDKRRAENATFEKILNDVKIDIQPSMIEREVDILLEEYKYRLSAQGFNADEIMNAQGHEKLVEELKPEAELRIKNSLVIDKIAQEENIKIDHSDLEKKFKEIEDVYHLDRENILKQLNQNIAMFNSLSQQALNEKVIHFLSENNTVKFVKK